MSPHARHFVYSLDESPPEAAALRPVQACAGRLGAAGLSPEGAQPALGRPGGGLKSSPLVEAEFAAIRKKVAFLERDRYLAPDIEAMRQWARQAELPAILLNILPSHS